MDLRKGEKVLELLDIESQKIKDQAAKVYAASSDELKKRKKEGEAIIEEARRIRAETEIECEQVLACVRPPPPPILLTPSFLAFALQAIATATANADEIKHEITAWKLDVENSANATLTFWLRSS